MHQDFGLLEYQDESKTKEILKKEKFAVIYESSEFQCNYENLLITANNQGVIINCIYIFDLNCPPQPTEFFSKSNVFSVSEPFSNSLAFQKTVQFSSSEQFSKSSMLSKSYFFSETEKFSRSSFFSETDKFSKSDFFSQSNKFTSSFYFSQTDKFTQFDAFTEGPSDQLPGGITCGVFDDDEYFQIDICKYSASATKQVYIIVLSDNLANYEQNEDGTAINLINCGLLCNNTKFIECVSLSGAGGAIYIKNSFGITNNATFIDASFFQCKASYGGAVYLSVDSDPFDISFNRCIFESNEALIKIRPTSQSTTNGNPKITSFIFLIFYNPSSIR